MINYKIQLRGCDLIMTIRIEDWMPDGNISSNLSYMLLNPASSAEFVAKVVRQSDYVQYTTPRLNWVISLDCSSDTWFAIKDELESQSIIYIDYKISKEEFDTLIPGELTYYGPSSTQAVFKPPFK